MIRPDDGALPGDPFWDVVKQRHPDIDIVILPPELSTTRVATATAPEASAAQARRSAEQVEELFDQMWDLVLPGHPVVIAPVRWEGGRASGIGSPVRSARVDHLEPDDARRLVTGADAALTARAWRVTPPHGRFHRVVATADDVTVTLSAHRDTCRLEVRGPEMMLGRETLRDLRRGAGA